MPTISYSTPVKASAPATAPTLNAVTTASAIAAAAISPIANVTNNVRNTISKDFRAMVLPTLADLKNLSEEALKTQFEDMFTQATDVAVFASKAASDNARKAVAAAANQAVLQAQMANAASASTPLPPMRQSDISALNKEGTRPLKVIITQDNGESLMLAALELQARRKQNEVWSKATTLATVSESPNIAAVAGPDCDILTDIIKVKRVNMNTIVTDRWSNPGAQARSSDGCSMEHAVNQFGILLNKSMDKDLQRAVEQDCGEHSQDGVLIWHILFHLIFSSKKVLVRTLIGTLRKITLEGFADVGLTYIGNIRELLRFGIGVENVDDDQEAMTQLLTAFQNHSDHLIQLKASEMSIDQLKEGSVETLSTLMNKLEPYLRQVSARDKVQSMMPNGSAAMIPGSPKKSSTMSTITVDDDERIVAMISTLTRNLDVKFENIIAGVNEMAGGCKMLDKEMVELRTSVKRKLNELSDDQHDNRNERPCERRRTNKDDTSRYGPAAAVRTNPNCPFFNEIPPENYDNKGRPFNGLTYHFKPTARGGKGGWYADWTPNDKDQSTQMVPYNVRWSNRNQYAPPADQTYGFNRNNTSAAGADAGAGRGRGRGRGQRRTDNNQSFPDNRNNPAASSTATQPTSRFGNVKAFLASATAAKLDGSSTDEPGR